MRYHRRSERCSKATSVPGRAPAVLIASVLLLAGTSGCATIVNGPRQDVAMLSTPPGATVKVADLETITPGKLTLRRNTDHNAVFMKEGFPERSVQLESRPSWWLLGNALFGGLIGLVVDLASGGGFKLVPDGVDMDLASGTVKEVETHEAKAEPRK